MAEKIIIGLTKNEILTICNALNESIDRYFDSGDRSGEGDRLMSKRADISVKLADAWVKEEQRKEGK